MTAPERPDRGTRVRKARLTAVEYLALVEAADHLQQIACEPNADRQQVGAARAADRALSKLYGQLPAGVLAEIDRRAGR